MALLISSTLDNPIHVQGTAIELRQVYNRLEFGCRPNGITIEIAFYTYADKSSFDAGNYLPTDLPTGNLVQDVDPLTQVQGLQAAHELAKAWYESLGYIVTIDLV
jgi:hypothetical protein